MPVPSFIPAAYRRYALAAAILLLLLVSLRIGHALYHNNRLNSQFTAASPPGPYQEKTAMDAMDLSVFDRLLPSAFSLPEFTLTPVLQTPVALRYYTEIPGNGAVPVLEIPQGSPIAALPPHATGSPFFKAGYGYTSYPTYERGWRYAQPFALAGAEANAYAQPYYYVAQKDLYAVSRVVMDAHKPLSAAVKQRGLISKQGAHTMTLYLDDLLYQNGQYLSPDLKYPLFDRLNAVLLSLAGFLLLVCLPLPAPLQRIFKRQSRAGGL